MRTGLGLVLTLLLFCMLYGFNTHANQNKNVLIINSYQHGFTWTDSLNAGIINELKKNNNILFYNEDLNSKLFVQSHFDLTYQFYKQKYSKVDIDGVIVTDNDALEFALKYNTELFPKAPVIFTGISNTEDYNLNDSNFWGFKESSNSDSIIDLIKQLLPHTKHILVITDETTTGKINREELLNHSKKFTDLTIEFPPITHSDSILSLIARNQKYDAMFYIGYNQNLDGKRVDNVLMLEKIGALANVPLFSNDRLFIGKGVIGGLSQSGFKQGEAAAQLLNNLMQTAKKDTIKRVYTQNLESFFDQTLLDKYHIANKLLPKNAIIINQKTWLNKKTFSILLSTLIILITTVIYLFLSNQKRKAEQHKSNIQLKEIEIQKNKLEVTSKQLEIAISELEQSNNNLLIAKSKAEEADKLKSAFLANVSHEIRTPLNSIVGFSSLLAEDDLDDETRNKYAELIESNSETLLVLIDEIIDLSKIEAQQLTIYKQEFSIDALMNELYQIFTNNHKNSKVELRISKISDEQELFVYSDKVRVKQIFINLLSNAYKFTDHAFIEMGYCITATDEIQLYVKDSGIGIDEEFHEAVFERFRKLNDDHKKVYSGTGLGLAITKKLVELLGGKIWISSHPGKGTTFYFTLSNLTLKSTSNP